MTFGPHPVIPLLHGFVEGGPCSLYQILQHSEPGVTDFRRGQAISATIYRASICVAGIHSGAMDDKCLDSARYTFTGISEWLPQEGIETWGKDAIVITLPNETKKLIDVCVRETLLSIQVRLFYELKHVKDEPGRLTRPIAVVEVRPVHPESLSWYLDIGNRLENLFSLLVGSSLAMQTMFVYMGEESGTVVMKRRTNSADIDPFDCVRCTHSQIANALAIWLSEPRRFRSVENVALGVLRRDKLFVETEFLSLAQSLEGFHRATTQATHIDKSALRRVRKHVSGLLQKETIDPQLQQRICMSMMQALDPTLKTRLSELCQRLTPSLMMRTGIQLPDFLDDVSNSRNFYTHTGKSDLEVKKKLALNGQTTLSSQSKASCFTSRRPVAPCRRTRISILRDPGALSNEVALANASRTSL